MKKQTSRQAKQIDAFLIQIETKSDWLMNFFLAGYFMGGIILAFYYDTWLVAIGVGGLSLIAYYSAKKALPSSNFYQYVLSAVLATFMSQYIYQMHGMFEMHFIAFIGSAILITYQNWKLQIPIALIVVLHHALFGYLQYVGFDQIYFTQLDYMDLRTFIIHSLLAATIFFICGLWAYHLKKARKKYMEVNAALDRFVYSVSHDLRAPLASMKGVIELSEDETNDPLIREHLNFLKGSINKLDGFIKDILEYSRNSRLDVKKENINFKEMLDDITHNLKYMCVDQRIVDVEIDVPDEAAFYSDKSRISIVLNNLISNAIRYQNPTTENPFVNIKVDTSDTETHIVVRDNGIGISKEQHQKIFDMFYRVSNNSVGSGLGLYIVKESIDKLNGQIEVESELGKGTEFSIRIPNN